MLFVRILFVAPLLSFAALTTSAVADVSTGVSLLETGDVSGAATQFAAAYEAGDGEGAFYLARLFELGLGTDPDAPRSANLYAAAAELGSERGQLRLGLMYHEGVVLLRDYTEGTRLICEAADAGLAEAQLNCGLSYQTGRGVGVDTEKAKEYWELAAVQNNVVALNVLGQTALSADDATSARGYFTAAAEAGNPVAMFSLAQLLDAQETPDLVGAYAWSNLAIVRGLTDAISLRDGLEARMDPSDVLVGQAQARSWTQAKLAEVAQSGE